MQQASYLEGGPLMWMLPLYLHINQKSDDDGDDDFNTSQTHNSFVSKFSAFDKIAEDLINNLFESTFKFY